VHCRGRECLLCVVASCMWSAMLFVASVCKVRALGQAFYSCVAGGPDGMLSSGVCGCNAVSHWLQWQETVHWIWFALIDQMTSAIAVADCPGPTLDGPGCATRPVGMSAACITIGMSQGTAQYGCSAVRGHAWSCMCSSCGAKSERNTRSGHAQRVCACLRHAALRWALHITQP